MNTQTMNSTTDPTATHRASVKADPTYTQALVNLLAREVELSRIEDEESAEYAAATEAVSTAWNALAAIVDAWAARQ